MRSTSSRTVEQNLLSPKKATDIRQYLSSQTELAFGFHVLRDSKLDIDDNYETYLLSHDSNSYQTLKNEENDFEEKSIKKIIQSSIKKEQSLAMMTFYTENSNNLPIIQEQVDDSESALSKILNPDDSKKINSLEKSSKTKKSGIQEHFDSINREMIRRTIKNPNINYCHYNSGNSVNKSAVINENENSYGSIHNYSPQNKSEFAPNFTKKLDLEVDENKLLKSLNSLQELQIDKFKKVKAASTYKNNPCLNSNTSITDYQLTSDKEPENWMIKGKNLHNDSFRDIQLIETKKDKNEKKELLLDSKKHLRNAPFKKHDNSQLQVVSNSNLNSNGEIAVRQNSLDSNGNEKAHFLIFPTDSVEYSNRDDMRLVSLDTTHEKNMFGKKDNEEKMTAEEHQMLDTDRQRKSISTKSMINKSSVKVIALETANGGNYVQMYPNQTQFEFIYNVDEKRQNELNINNIQTFHSQSNGTCNEIFFDINNKCNKFPQDIMSCDEIKNEDKHRMCIDVRSPGQNKIVTAIVTDLSMPVETHAQRKSSKSPTSNQNVHSIEKQSTHKSLLKNSHVYKEDLSKKSIQKSKNIHENIAKIRDFECNEKLNNFAAKTSQKYDHVSTNSNTFQTEDKKKKKIDSKSQIVFQNLTNIQENNIHKNSNPEISSNNKKFGTIKRNVSQNISKKVGQFDNIVTTSELKSVRRNGQTPIKTQKTIQEIPYKRIQNKTPNILNHFQAKSPVFVSNRQICGNLISKHNNDLFKHHLNDKSRNVKNLNVCKNSPKVENGSLSHKPIAIYPIIDKNVLNSPISRIFTRSSTPSQPKKIEKVQNNSPEVKSCIEDNLFHEIQQAIGYKYTKLESSMSPFTQNVISCSKSIRILNYLHLISSENITNEDCRLIGIMFNALDPNKTRKVNLRDFQLFVFAIFGIEKNNVLLEKDVSNYNNFAISQRPSTNSAKQNPSQFGVLTRNKSEVYFNNESGSKKKNHRGSHLSEVFPSFLDQNENYPFTNDPNIMTNISFIEGNEIKKIEKEFKRFRQNRADFLSAVQRKNSNLLSPLKSFSSIASVNLNIPQKTTGTMHFFPKSIFKKPRNFGEIKTVDLGSGNVTRNSSKTNTDMTVSQRNIQKKDLISENEVFSQFENSRKSLFSKNISSPNCIFTKSKVSASSRTIGIQSFLPILKRNEQRGNILKLDVIIGPNQSEEIYVHKGELETIEAKVEKLRKKVNLNANQCSVILDIVKRETKELEWY